MHYNLQNLQKLEKFPKKMLAFYPKVLYTIKCATQSTTINSAIAKR